MVMKRNMGYSPEATDVDEDPQRKPDENKV